MERVVEEAEYVLAVLYRMRDEVSADPKLFDPDAQEQIDEAIVRMKDVQNVPRLVEEKDVGSRKTKPSSAA